MFCQPSRCICLVSIFLTIALLSPVELNAGELKARLKWSSNALSLPTQDVLKQSVGSFLTDHRSDFRLQFKQSIGDIQIEIDPVFTWLGGDAVETLYRAGVPIDDLPGSDVYQLFDWSTELYSSEEYRMVSRLDRFNVQYRTPSWSLGVGRQAVSWGNGLTFQPLDLFSPFSPLAVDREFKPGVDSVLFESLIGSNSEIQLLYIDRQRLADNSDTQTAAMKWLMQALGLSFEAYLAEHRGETLVGFSTAVPLGGSLLRIDTSRMCDSTECTVSGLANIDYTIAVGPSLIYLFGEYYHNGFGVDSVTEQMSPKFEDRLARGEVFTLMKDYAAAGVNVTWHPLWSQTVVFLRNLKDDSTLAQTSISYDPNDESRVQFGIAMPFGHHDSEFGRKWVGEDATTAGHTQWFFSISYYL